MPSLLLPGTAAPFAPRSPPTVVLNTKVDPWLTATLKRINRIKRPLNSAPQHKKCLTETLSSPEAIWTLCSLLVERAPESEIEKNENPIIDALFRYQLLHVQAYVVHIDLVLGNEIAFKLSQDTIKELIDYHKNVYLEDCKAKSWHWTEKEAQAKKLHENFIQTVNKYVFRTDAIALEGMEDDGSGELLCGGSLEVKNAVLGFFVPLLPPPPRAVEIPRPVPLLPSSPATTNGANWWSPTPPPNPTSQPPPVESWKVIPSSPASDLPSTSAPSLPPHSAPMWDSLPELSQATTQPSQYSTPPVSMPFTFTSAPPQLPLPSLVAQQCSTGVSAGFGGFGWDRGFPDYATTM